MLHGKLKCVNDKIVLFKHAAFYVADIDECSTENNNCSVNSLCSNTIGSYECFCHDGYLDEGLGYVCTGMVFKYLFILDSRCVIQCITIGRHLCIL